MQAALPWTMSQLSVVSQALGWLCGQGVTFQWEPGKPGLSASSHECLLHGKCEPLWKESKCRGFHCFGFRPSVWGPSPCLAFLPAPTGLGTAIEEPQPSHLPGLGHRHSIPDVSTRCCQAAFSSSFFAHKLLPWKKGREALSHAIICCMCETHITILTDFKCTVQWHIAFSQHYATITPVWFLNQERKHHAQNTPSPFSGPPAFGNSKSTLCLYGFA